MRLTLDLFLAAVALLAVGSCRDDLRDIDCSSINSAYTANISPIILNSCVSPGCHNAGSTNGDFTTYAGLKAVADDGSLDDAVNIKKTMPKNGSLSVDDRKKIRCWINNGAPNN